MPLVGLPLGNAIICKAADQQLIFYYPYNPSNYGRDEQEWLIDHSMFVVGNQGRGKTNFMLYLSLVLSSWCPEELGEGILNCTLDLNEDTTQPRTHEGYLLVQGKS